MGVILYELLLPHVANLWIGSCRFEIGLLSRRAKLSEIGLRDPTEVDRIEELLAADAVETPPLAMVSDPTLTGRDVPVVAHRVLGWDANRRVTQDLDWNHMPTLGWAVCAPDGCMVLHAGPLEALRFVDTDEAVASGIIDADGRLRRAEPAVITRCDRVRHLLGGHYQADCALSDGRTVAVLGESELGEPPPPEWFVGRSPARAAVYGVVEQLATGAPQRARNEGPS